MFKWIFRTNVDKLAVIYFDRVIFRDFNKLDKGNTVWKWAWMRKGKWFEKKKNHFQYTIPTTHRFDWRVCLTKSWLSNLLISYIFIFIFIFLLFITSTGFFFSSFLIASTWLVIIISIWSMFYSMERCNFFFSLFNWCCPPLGGKKYNLLECFCHFFIFSMHDIDRWVCIIDYSLIWINIAY